MERHHLDIAIRALGEANDSLEPERLSVADARVLIDLYASVQRRAAFGLARLAARVDDTEQLAKSAGTSVARARETVATGKVLGDSDDLSDALRCGEISLDQATEIAKAEASAPGSAAGLIQIAKDRSFSVLREQARKTKLEAEAKDDLFDRQHRAREARSYTDELGMFNLHLRLQPHVGTPLEARAEAHAQRLYRAVPKDQREPFARYLADAYAKMLEGPHVKGPARRPELVVLVSHTVAERGWNDVRDGEVCKIPGVGPIAPRTAKELARDAFINAVVFDGKDLRQFKRFTRHIPKEILIALELGDPPDFDGVRCIDCGNRFRPEFDHLEPRAARGPTSKPNLCPRCNPCHKAKTERDRKAGKLGPPRDPRARKPKTTSRRE
ncbi:MAG: HNH endonuclease [Actinomycetota bacterium]